MRVLVASSEVYPYSKTGGLADMAGALAKSLAEAGQEVGVITPLYRGIREKHPGLQPANYDFNLLVGDDWVQGRLWSLQPQEGLTVYFVEQAGYFDRPGLYQESALDYPDNSARFAFFSKAVANFARHHPLQPEIVHLHDWQVGPVPLLIKHESRAGGWNPRPATVLTIHNLAYQGVFPATHYSLLNLPKDYFNPEGVEFYERVNFLKTAIVYSDMLTTVSPRYAREITTEQYGCGLDGVLRKRLDALAGILNGVDYTEWNTEANKLLPANYSVDNLLGKADAKRALQEKMGLPERPDAPLFGTVSRLADQKGVDIQLAALEEMLSADMQFALLGSGSPEYEQGFQRLAKRHPGKVAVKIGYDHALAHLIEAGCDFFLMPSKFEPCGLNQMYSLRYGTIPIVRVTGGLDDSVIDITQDMEKANGIKFYSYTAAALAKAIRKALVLYQQPEWLERFRLNGMQADFSWELTTREYLKVYERALLARDQARELDAAHA